MEKQFWHNRWKNNEIGFHQYTENPFLVKYFHRLNLKNGQRVFIPLCGKTRDIAWLLNNNCQVIGVELVQSAVKQLFLELGITPRIQEKGNLLHYQSANIDIFVGDIFHATFQKIGTLDAVYDRAALVALPHKTRQKYTRHICQITQNAPQLLITYEYDQSLAEGPPFSISHSELKQHYQASHEIQLLESNCETQSIRGEHPAKEHGWLLNKI